MDVADDDARIEIGSGTDDDGFRTPNRTEIGYDLGDGAVFQPNVRNFRLNQRKSVRVLDGFFHDLAVKHAVCLNPLGLDGRAFARIEDAVLQHDLVRGTSHFAAERVDFKDKLSLARAADRRIARHIRHGVVGDGKKHGIPCAPRREPPRSRRVPRR